MQRSRVSPLNLTNRPALADATNNSPAEASFATFKNQTPRTPTLLKGGSGPLTVRVENDQREKEKFALLSWGFKKKSPAYPVTHRNQYKEYDFLINMYIFIQLVDSDMYDTL